MRKALVDTTAVFGRDIAAKRPDLAQIARQLVDDDIANGDVNPRDRKRATEAVLRWLRSRLDHLGRNP